MMESSHAPPQGCGWRWGKVRAVQGSVFSTPGPKRYNPVSSSSAVTNAPPGEDVNDGGGCAHVRTAGRWELTVPST